MTPSATAGGRQAKRWTREAIIEKIREWAAMYGEPPRAADWNPSSAKWSGAEWRADRYRAGDWPSLNAAKAPFGGRFTDAIIAAGFEPARTGPPSRKALAEAPVHADELVMEPRARALLDAAQARARDLEAKLATRDRQLERAYAVNAAAREYVPASERPQRPERPPKTITKTETRVVEPRVGDPAADRRAKAAERRLARFERDVDGAREAAAAAGLALRDAKRDATRLASRLERAEATINTLRAEKRELGQASKDAEARAGQLEREVERLREREPEVKVITSATDTELAAALAARDQAEREAREAERRAAIAEREHREIAALVTGQQRRLTQAEVAELRRRGPAGERVLAGALKALAKARAAGGKEPLREALTRIAEAAVTWRDRL